MMKKPFASPRQLSIPIVFVMLASACIAPSDEDGDQLDDIEAAVVGEGVYRQRSAVGHCVYAPGPLETRVEVRACGSTANQDLRYVSLGGDVFQIKVAGTSRCLAKSEDNVVVRACDSSKDNQRWKRRVDASGGVMFQSPNGTYMRNVTQNGFVTLGYSKEYCTPRRCFPEDPGLLWTLVAP